MSLFVGNLSSHVQHRELENAFRRFGRSNLELKDGYGFVVFEEYRDADRALKALQGRSICGQRPSISWAKRHRPFQRYSGKANSFQQRGTWDKSQGHANRRRSVSDKDSDDVRKEPKVADGSTCSDIKDEDATDTVRREDWKEHVAEVVKDEDPLDGGRWGEPLSDGSPEHLGDESMREVEDVLGVHERQDVNGSAREISHESPRAKSRAHSSREFRSSYDHHRGGRDTGGNSQERCFKCGHLGHVMRNCRLRLKNVHPRDNFDRRNHYNNVHVQGFRGGFRGMHGSRRIFDRDIPPSMGRRNIRTRDTVSDRRFHEPVDIKSRDQSRRKHQRSESRKRDPRDSRERSKRKHKKSHKKSSHSAKKRRRSSSHSPSSRSRSSSSSPSRSQSRSPGSRSRSRSHSHSRSSSSSRSKSSNSPSPSSRSPSSPSPSHQSRSRSSSRSHSRSASSRSRTVSPSSRSPKSLSKSHSRSRSRSLSPSGSRQRSISPDPRVLFIKSPKTGSSSRSNAEERAKSPLKEEDEQEGQGSWPLKAAAKVDSWKEGLEYSSEDHNADEKSRGYKRSKYYREVKEFSNGRERLPENMGGMDTDHGEGARSRYEQEKPADTSTKGVSVKGYSSSVRAGPTSDPGYSVYMSLAKEGHGGVALDDEGKNMENSEAARLWPVEAILYRRLKRGPISMDNYEKRKRQNEEYGITDKFIRSSSGWWEKPV